MSSKTKIADLSSQILKGDALPFGSWSGRFGLEFSEVQLRRFFKEEMLHDHFLKEGGQPLSSMSSGEQRKFLFYYLISQNPDFLILVNPFDYLDKGSQAQFRGLLNEHSKKISLIQFFSRDGDILEAIEDVFLETEKGWERLPKKDFLAKKSKNINPVIDLKALRVEDLPPEKTKGDTLVKIENLNIAFAERPILHKISWTVCSGEFWQLSGENGSGKSTLLSVIIGNSSKGYGQNVELFGYRKGSGESVWDIKKNIGYYNPDIPMGFASYQTATDILLGGFYDSVGLYQRAGGLEKSLVKEWFRLMRMEALEDKSYTDLTIVQQRLLMIARAMVKQPKLLIIDEPTAGLDEEGCGLIIALVRQIKETGRAAIIYVSHRMEESLNPQHLYLLEKSEKGSLGRVVY